MKVSVENSYFFFFFFFFFASYGDSPVYRCIPFTGAIHKIAVFYMFYDFPLLISDFWANIFYCLAIFGPNIY